MTSDKPKHKPNTKHTLEEVLKSLHDLIRNDLVEARTPAPPPEAPASESTASHDSDEFNAALDKLDEIITHKLIEPVERAQRLPPQAVEDITPEDDAADAEPPEADEESIESPEFGAQDEDIVLESPDAVDPDAVDTDVEKRDDVQEAFSFDELPALEETNEPLKPLPSSELELDADSARPAPTDEAQGLSIVEWENAPTVEYAPSSEAPNDAPPDEPPAAIEPDQAPAAANEPVIDAAAEELLVAPPPGPPPVRQEPAITPRDDIPVLNEVAHEILSQTGGMLPAPERAREIAIQVIARLNIELRQNGRQPLDTRTIHRLQQLLRHALSARPTDDQHR